LAGIWLCGVVLVVLGPGSGFKKLLEAFAGDLVVDLLLMG